MPRLGRCHAWLMASRSSNERKADALAKLEAIEANVWVASGSPTGAVHLIPMTHTWNGTQVVLATEPMSRTVANVTANPRVRLALGETRDVVMIDAIFVEAVPKAEAPVALADAYSTQAGWDPRTDGDDYVFLLLRPSASRYGGKPKTLPGAPLCAAGHGWSDSAGLRIGTLHHLVGAVGICLSWSAVGPARDLIGKRAVVCAN